MMGGRTEAEGDVRRSACGPCSSASTPSGRKEKEEEILSAEETKGKRRVLPPSREEIGRCSWKVLHSMAARYPENPVRLFSRLFLHHHHFASSFLPSLSRVSRQLSRKVASAAEFPAKEKEQDTRGVHTGRRTRQVYAYLSPRCFPMTLSHRHGSLSSVMLFFSFPTQLFSGLSSSVAMPS